MLIALLFLLQAPPAAPMGEAIAATVNGERIPLAVVDALAKNPPGNPGIEVPDLKLMRPMVLENLIQERLWMQFFRKHGPKITSIEGETIIQANLVVLKSRNQTFADYCKEWRQTETQARGRWLLEAQLATFLETRITEAKVKEHFEANKDYYAGARIKAKLITIRLSATARNGDRIAARDKVRQFKATIEAGTASFDELAKKHSVDPKAPLGGDYGFLTRDDGRWDDALLRAAFAVPVGKVSDPIETEFGVHLVTVTERDPGKPTSYEMVKDVARSRCMVEVMDQHLKKLTAEAKIAITLPE